MSRMKDMTGERIGKVVVIKRAPDKVDSRRRTMWLCRCDCGNELIMRGDVLREGVISCGCQRQAKVTTHGKSGSVEFSIWRDMIQRCSNPKRQSYKYYGARGIKVCNRWKKFENFYADMGARPSSDHSIDRIDVNGDYEPSNCRWSTKTEQALNQRMKSTNKSGHKGVYRCKEKWVSQFRREYLGIYSDINDAIKARKDAEERYFLEINQSGSTFLVS